MRVLVTEDEREMALLLKTALQEAGYAVDVVHTGERAVDAIADTYYDAIVLDVMLPGLNGFETCRRIRGRGIGAPILMLTARAGDRDRVSGLDAGAVSVQVVKGPLGGRRTGLRGAGRGGGDS